MATFLAQANLTVAGQQLLWGREYELPEGDPEVQDCVAINYLLPRLPDGSYAEPKPPAPLRCCGG